jgi:hypothetical protein
MINLFRFKNTEDGIVNKPFENTEAYRKYIDNRLFLCIEKQPIFCQGCGDLEVNPRDFERHLKYCPRCGKEHPMWSWDGASLTGLTIDILINGSIKKDIEIILVLMAVAHRHGVKINWYTQTDDGPKLIEYI